MARYSRLALLMVLSMCTTGVYVTHACPRAQMPSSVSTDWSTHTHTHTHTQSANVRKVIQAHSQVCTDVAFHPARPSTLASCSWDHSVALWGDSLPNARSDADDIDGEGELEQHGRRDAAGVTASTTEQLPRE